MKILLSGKLLEAFQEMRDHQEKAHKAFWSKVREELPESPSDLRLDTSHEDLGVVVLSDMDQDQAMRNQALSMFK